MDNYDDYYYRLGRHQAVIELVDGVPKALPIDLNIQQRQDWQQGYNEMLEVLNWQRRPVREEKQIA